MQEHASGGHAGFDQDEGPLADLGGATYKAGALDGKTLELIGVAVGVVVHCNGCIALHTRAARHHGANRNELLEAVGVALHMGGGAALEHGLEAVRVYDGVPADDDFAVSYAG